MPFNPRKNKLESDCQPLVEDYQQFRFQLIEKLYDTYAPAFYGYILKNVKAELDAQRILEDSFIQIATDLHSFRPKEKSLFCWMLSIVIVKIKQKSTPGNKNFIEWIKEKVGHLFAFYPHT